MASGLFLFYFLPLLVFPGVAHSWIEEGNGTSTSIYEVLEQYNFPVGLLPRGVLGYDLNPSTGYFSAYLSVPCYFRLTSKLQLRYRPTVSGVISKGRLSNLNGVKVKVRHMWLRISEVRRDGDSLVFHVGVTFMGFPVTAFNESPRCGNCWLNGGVSSS